MKESKAQGKTCEDDHADVWVVARVVKAAYYLGGGLGAERVAPLRAIYGDLHDSKIIILNMTYTGGVHVLGPGGCSTLAVPLPKVSSYISFLNGTHRRCAQLGNRQVRHLCNAFTDGLLIYHVLELLLVHCRHPPPARRFTRNFSVHSASGVSSCVRCVEDRKVTESIEPAHSETNFALQDMFK